MLWYSIPGYTSIECNEQGDIRSSRTKRLRKPQRRTGQPGQRKRLYINVSVPGESQRKMWIHRLVLSAKLERQLEPWEEACHQNGDAGDNRMSNLEVGCRLNNVIDDFETGRLQTSVEQIDRAIERLSALKERYNNNID